MFASLHVYPFILLLFLVNTMRRKRPSVDVGSSLSSSQNFSQDHTLRLVFFGTWVCCSSVRPAIVIVLSVKLQAKTIGVPPGLRVGVRMCGRDVWRSRPHLRMVSRKSSYGDIYFCSFTSAPRLRRRRRLGSHRFAHESSTRTSVYTPY